jgi:hypothetical protein
MTRTMVKAVKPTDALDTLPELGGFWELMRMREVIRVNAACTRVTGSCPAALWPVERISE